MDTKINLRPSGSKRWLSCPASVKHIQGLIDDGTIKDESSSYADEGSLAHALAAIQLGKEVEYDPEWYDLYYCEEMQGYVDDYVHFVQLDVPPEDHDHTVLIEQGVTLFYHPEAPQGTADAVIINNTTQHMYIKDLKYGMGVSVQAEDNTQLMIYAMSVLKEYHELGVVGGNLEDWAITMQIYQPRVIGEEAVREWCITYKTLENECRPITVAAERHLDDKGWDMPYGPSEEACRFCPAAAGCSAHADYLLGELPLDPRSKDVKDMPKPTTMSADDIARVVSVQKQLVKWMGKVESYAKDSLLEGKEIPGYQLVKTLRNRAWADEEDAEKFLRRHFPKDVCTPPKLVSPTTAEALLKKKAKTKKMRPSTWDNFESLFLRDEGNPALATLDDKREPFLPPTAEAEFSEDPSDLL